MADKFKVLEVGDHFEVVDQHGDLVKCFYIRPSDGKYARCHAYDRAWAYIESISAIRW